MRDRVHRIPLPTLVTIAKRPSCGNRTGKRKPLIWGLRQAEYFFGDDWTTQIRLNPFDKFRFARTAISPRANQCGGCVGVNFSITSQIVSSLSAIGLIGLKAVSTLASARKSNGRHADLSTSLNADEVATWRKRPAAMRGAG
jgi:hypothetical protein